MGTRKKKVVKLVYVAARHSSGMIFGLPVRQIGHVRRSPSSLQQTLPLTKSWLLSMPVAPWNWFYLKSKLNQTSLEGLECWPTACHWRTNFNTCGEDRGSGRAASRWRSIRRPVNWKSSIRVQPTLPEQDPHCSNKAWKPRSVRHGAADTRRRHRCCPMPIFPPSNLPSPAPARLSTIFMHTLAEESKGFSS